MEYRKQTTATMLILAEGMILLSACYVAADEKVIDVG